MNKDLMISKTIAIVMLVALAMKWHSVGHIIPIPGDTSAILKSITVAIYLLGTVFAVFGLLRGKVWGCIHAYAAILGATLIGISTIPGLPVLVPAGIPRTYFVIAINAAMFAGVALLHLRIQRKRL